MIKTRDSKAFDLGFKHGSEDRAAGNAKAKYTTEDYSEAYLMGYNKGFESGYQYQIDCT